MPRFYSSKNRISYIDAARGAAIILLIAGHIITGDSPVFNWIFSFHIPLFFFLSGMCAKDPSAVRLIPYLKQRAKKRLLPYLGITAAGLCICLLIPDYRHVILNDGMPLQLKHIFLLMEPRNLYIGQVWFLSSLFWAELYFYIWQKLGRRLPLCLQAGSLLIFLLLARHIWRIYPVIPLLHDVPFQIDTAFMGAFCYCIGFWAKKYSIPEHCQRFGKYLILPALCLNIYFGTYLNGYVNLCGLIFGNILFYTISMLCGIFAIVMTMYYLPLTFLQWYGKYSLQLFASHTFLIYLVREAVYLITGYHYTMMGDVPLSLACLMTSVILILFFLFRKGFAALYLRVLLTGSRIRYFSVSDGSLPPCSAQAAAYTQSSDPSPDP